MQQLWMISTALPASKGFCVFSMFMSIFPVCVNRDLVSYMTVCVFILLRAAVTAGWAFIKEL